MKRAIRTLMIGTVACAASFVARADPAATTQPASINPSRVTEDLVARLEVAAPKVRISNAEAVNRGVAFLQTSQQPDGCWGTGLETRGTEIYSMVPGSRDAYRVGTTALRV